MHPAVCAHDFSERAGCEVVAGVGEELERTHTLASRLIIRKDTRTVRVEPTLITPFNLSPNISHAGVRASTKRFCRDTIQVKKVFFS